MELLGRDETGRRYYCVRYSRGCLRAYPWRKSRFDAAIFVNKSTADEEVEACIRELVAQNNDWIYTFGSDSKRWHDRIDEISVEEGRQKQVGDGSPMTAWFERVKTLNRLRTSYFHGAYTTLIVLVGFGDKEAKQIEGFKKTLRPNKPLKRDAAKNRRAS